ncbi:hypothetical protein [Gryllotalpicola ginsengisoli]|uniref:hypothetical protein n=1 Tax=Gryllotalpicola ginsengisoli TaxID=444608 RepID=UPI0003B5B3C4|nr:hypothetical protein [Gryllotalpicola ginsengisoli]
MIDFAEEGRRAGRELWPAGASWVPEEVNARFEELLERHPSPDPEAARAEFLNTARNARKSAPTQAEAAGRAELLARLRERNAARTAAERARHEAEGVPIHPEAAAIARRRRASLERRRRA